MARYWGNDEQGQHRVGDVGFLVEVDHEMRDQGPQAYSLYDRPAHTNQSHMPRLEGWCGTTNGRIVYAHGLAKVVRALPNGRVQYEQLTDPTEIATALDSLGYPDLTPVA